ncbi:MAG: helix-turn-helix domain-containing protein [Acidimicrobiales bacterium]
MTAASPAGGHGQGSPFVRDLPDRVNDLGAFIREQRNTARLSLRRLSELAGVSNPYLSQIERGLRRPSAEILQQIAKALRISAETLYVQAGILERPDGEGDLARYILSDRYLSEDQKQVLLRIYLSFRHENDPDDPDGERRHGDAGTRVTNGATVAAEPHRTGSVVVEEGAGATAGTRAAGSFRGASVPRRPRSAAE